MAKVKMEIQNADLQVGAVKINSVSSSSVVIFGDAESFFPRTVSVTRGLKTPRPFPSGGPGGPGGPVGATR